MLEAQRKKRNGCLSRIELQFSELVGILVRSIGERSRRFLLVALLAHVVIETAHALVTRADNRKQPACSAFYPLVDIVGIGDKAHSMGGQVISGLFVQEKAFLT